MFDDVRVKAAVAVFALITVVCGTAIIANKEKSASAPPVAITGAPTPTAISSVPVSATTAPAGTGAAAPPPNSSPAAPSDSSTYIYVDVSGGVRHPGLYRLRTGSRVANALHSAGGALKSADLSQLNLAEPLLDGEKLDVPRIGDQLSGVQALPTTSMNSAPGSVVPPNPPNIPAVAPSPTISAKAPFVSSGKTAKFRTPADGKVNLNTASEQELQQLPGVGPAMAAKIVAYRQQAGPFRSVDDLREVGGIGDKKLMRIAPFVVVN